MLTLTYGGSVTGDAATTTSWASPRRRSKPRVRYLAADFGPQGIRVNAISAGPMRTLAGAGISDARPCSTTSSAHAPLQAHRHPRRGRRRGALPAVRSSGGVTGEIHYVDSGYHIISMPTLDELKTSGLENGEE